MATNRKLSWSNAREVRRSLSAVNNMLLNDKIEPDRARAKYTQLMQYYNL